MDTHLEALTGVAVATTPHTQGKLVVQREEKRPGHILTIRGEISYWSPAVRSLRITGDWSQTLETLETSDMCHQRERELNTSPRTSDI